MDKKNDEREVKIDSINIEDNDNYNNNGKKTNNKNEIEYDQVDKFPNSNVSNNNRLSFELKCEESIDKDLRMADQRFEVPQNLKKTFICSLILFIVGATLIGIGFIQDVAAADPGKGITFWTLGGIVMIPGGYYSYQFYKAKKSKDEQERDDILSEIPEL